MVLVISFLGLIRDMDALFSTSGEVVADIGVAVYFPKAEVV